MNASILRSLVQQHFAANSAVACGCSTTVQHPHVWHQKPYACVMHPRSPLYFVFLQIAVVLCTLFVASVLAAEVGVWEGHQALADWLHP